MNGASEIRAGVIGLGFGAVHARVLDEIEGVRLAAVCDPNEERLATVARGRDLKPYVDYKAMLAAERLDAVVVAVPATLHAPVALAAIEAGCALLVEKPLAPSLAEGAAIVEGAAAANLPLMAGHIERFNPAVRALVELVRNGEIGRVLQLTARRMGPIIVRAQDVNVVHDSALHDIDVMRHILCAEIETVFASAQVGLLPPLEDSVLAVLRFAAPAGGPAPVASLDVNWRAPRRIRDLAVLGESGLLVLDYAAQTLDLYRGGGAWTRPAASPGWSPASGGEGVPIPITPAEPLKEELAAFVAALRDGEPMPVTGEDALAALAAADAITESARRGMPVRPRRG
jgi:UDP-N-acetylglucosamine 3-dehydrogenase